MLKKWGYLFYIFISLMYLELVFKYIVFDKFSTIGIVNVMLFTIPITIAIYLITSLFNKIVNQILAYFIMSLLTFIFIGQMIYFKIYDSIFSVLSIENSNAVVEYFGFVVEKIIKNNIAVFYLLIPLLFLIVFRTNIFISQRPKRNTIIILIILMIAIQFGTIQTLSKKGLYSEYNLYYKVNSPMLSVNKLGLITTIRLDIQRLIFGYKDTNNIPTNKDDTSSNNKEQEEEKITYNILDIDWDTLIANEKDSAIRMMHEYFKNVEPTNQNDHTGIFKGKNLIWILAEGFDSIAIDKDITPTLYKIATEGYNFTNFYTPIFRSTIDGEYMTKISLLPKEGVNSMYYVDGKSWPFALGNLFKDLEYKTTAYHNGTATYYRRNISHPNLGYEKYIACGQGLNIHCSSWPQSDLELVEATAKDFINQDKPFMTYYLTISGHLRHNKWNAMALKNWDVVKDLNYSDPIKCYMSQHVELDKALAKLISYLEEAGKAKDTVIAISTDHWPYGLSIDLINERANPKVNNEFDRDRLPFIIWHKGITPTKVDKLGSSIDIVPTLANLFGLEYDSRLLMGRDLFSDADPIVVFANRSWITDKGLYNTVTGKFDNYTSSEVSQTYIDEINQTLYNRFNMSKLILDKNYYKTIK